MARSLLTAMDNSVGSGRVVPVAGNGVQLLDHNEDRLSVVIGSDSAADISLSNQPGDVWPNGIIIAAKGQPLTLTRELHGGIVRKRWFASASAGTAQIYVATADDTHRQNSEVQ